MPRTTHLLARALLLVSLWLPLAACEPPPPKPTAVSEPAAPAEASPEPAAGSVDIATPPAEVPMLTGRPIDIPGHDAAADTASSGGGASLDFEAEAARRAAYERYQQQQRAAYEAQRAMLEREYQERMATAQQARKQAERADDNGMRAREAAAREQAMLEALRQQQAAGGTMAKQAASPPSPAPVVAAAPSPGQGYSTLPPTAGAPAPYASVSSEGATGQTTTAAAPPASTATARDKAMSNGLLQFSDQLAGLVDNPAVGNSLTSNMAATTDHRLERYPSIETRARVVPGQAFSVQVSLTEDQITPEVVIKQGSQVQPGKLGLSLDERSARRLNNELVWDLDVVLSAPGFDLQGADRQTISLPRNGDSTPALFTLAAQPINGATQPRKLFVTFWHKGAYLAKVIRPIDVAQAGASVAALPANTAPATPPPVTALQMDLGIEAPDLTLWLQRDNEHPEQVLVLMHSPYLQPTSYHWRLPNNLRELLGARYQQIARLQRGDYRDGAFQPTAAQVAANVATLTGFGRDLYQRYAPPPFKEAFWALKDKLGPRFDSIQVFSNDPLLPWELMRPQRGKQETDFLGIDFRLARWHVNDGGSQLDRPPQQLRVNDLMLIAPNYPDRPLSQVAKVERAALRAMTGVHRIEGDATAFGNLLRGEQKLQGIVHFAGHGIVRQGPSGIPEYAIAFEHQEMNLLMLRGLVNPHSGNHPFYFFNACDVGQSAQVANFVDGWAPSVLEAGASGYIGGLWPLDDQGAAEFARSFYQQLNQDYTHGPVTVSDLLRDSRKQFYRNGNPTFLAYVYYGDPNLRVSGQ